MIKRFPTKCNECGHFNTLRVVLGTDRAQTHTVPCFECGQEMRISFDIDFVNRETLLETSKFGALTSPSIENVCFDGCIPCDTEGTVTNLDPNFMIPAEFLHQDRVFPWMMGANPVPEVRLGKAKPGKVVDVLDALGIARGLREGMVALVKAIDFLRNKRADLANQQLAKLSQISGQPVRSTGDGLQLVVGALLGEANAAALPHLFQQADRAEQLNPEEFSRMRAWMNGGAYGDYFDRQVGVLRDYLKGYDQLCQGWIYAVHEDTPRTNLTPSMRDLDRVQKFYGNTFEQLASGLVLPAALNNILSGRPFDQFEQMTLTQYIATDKSGRAKCLQNNVAFSPLHAEFDSSIRNGSHHQGFRLKPGTTTTIQFRTGDNKAWKDIAFSEYLWRCNRILFCAMRLLALQVYVLGLDLD